LFSAAEVDAIEIASDADKYSRAKGISTTEFRSAGGPSFRGITLNGTSPALQDVRVRRAISMAIDRATLARAMLAPLELVPKMLENHIFMPNQSGYQNNSGYIGSFDPVKAGELLDSAGWKLDGEVRRKDGKPLAMNFTIPSDVAVSRQESQLVQNMLGKIGITVELRVLPRETLFDKYIRPGDFELTVYSWIGTAYPLATAKSLYAMPKKGPGGTIAVQQNYSRIGHPGIDSLFDLANAQVDRAKAIEYGNRADSLIWDIVHSLPLYQRPELLSVRRNLANFGAFGFAQPWVYQDIGWMK
jgi:peptide/nickel transport system substrate-binding protein